MTEERWIQTWVMRGPIDLAYYPFLRARCNNIRLLAGGREIGDLKHDVEFEELDRPAWELGGPIIARNVRVAKTSKNGGKAQS